jgi:hypothetical protein
MLLVPPTHCEHPSLAATGRALAAALARVAPDRRAISWQDGLDLLAVMAGLKPLCLLGRGDGDAMWTDALGEAASCADLTAIAASPWEPDDAEDPLPRWYRDATARRRARRTVLYLCRDDATLDAVAALSRKGRVTADEEAVLLGYPRCCVEQHHRQAVGFAHLTAAMAARAAAGDRARMVRMIEAGAAPMPASSEEWERYRALTAIAPSRWTSVNLCRSCAGGGDGPARRLERAYERLAARAGYPAH